MNSSTGPDLRLWLGEDGVRKRGGCRLIQSGLFEIIRRHGLTYDPLKTTGGCWHD
jgi:hypothetical protein